MPSCTDEQKSMAVDMVDECGGSVTRAMRKLGYPTRQTLYHWLNRRDASHERKAGRPWSRYRQGSYANLPMSRWGHWRYRPTSCPPSLRAAIRLGNACGPTRSRLCISAWRSPASARISRRGTCRRRGFGGESPC